ncbi:unnamed protein product, partial [Amoebophrya sp. A25]
TTDGSATGDEGTRGPNIKGMVRVGLLYDIAPQFGPQLTKYLVDMQRFFTQ